MGSREIKRQAGNSVNSKHRMGLVKQRCLYYTAEIALEN